MFNMNGKYGNIHINDKVISLDSAKLNELETFLNELEHKKNELIEKQNKLLTDIIE